MVGSTLSERELLLAVTAMISIFMGSLDATAVNVALPHIAGSLSSTPEESSGVLTAFLVASAITLPTAGWLAGRYGRRRVLSLAIILFWASSLLCSLSTSLGLLVISRVLQGLSHGPIQPLSQAALLETVEAKRRGKGMALLGIGVVLAPLLGPTIGGLIIEHYSWRWIFLVNLPVATVALLLNLAFMPEQRLGATQRHIDWAGLLLLVAWVVPAEFILALGQRHDWFDSSLIKGLCMIGLVSLAGFLWWEFHVREPVVDIRLFSFPTYVLGCFLMVVLSFVFYGSMILLPLWLQTVQNYPPIQTGIVLSPRGIGTLVGLFIVGRMFELVSPRVFLGFGLALGSVSLFALSRLGVDAGAMDFVWPQVIQGLSFSMLWVPLTIFTMAIIPKDRLQHATGVFSLIRNLGGGAGIALSLTVVQYTKQRVVNVLGGGVTPLNQIAKWRWPSLFTAVSYMQRRREYQRIFETVEHHASVASFLRSFAIFSLLFVLAIPLIAFAKLPSKHDRSQANDR